MAHVLYTYKLQVKSGGTWIHAWKKDYPALTDSTLYLDAEAVTAWNNNWATWNSLEQAMIDAGKVVWEDLPTTKTIDGVSYSTHPGIKMTFATEADKLEYEAIYDNADYLAQLDTMQNDINCILPVIDLFTEE